MDGCIILKSYLYYFHCVGFRALIAVSSSYYTGNEHHNVSSCRQAFLSHYSGLHFDTCTTVDPDEVGARIALAFSSFAAVTAAMHVVLEIEICSDS